MTTIYWQLYSSLTSPPSPPWKKEEKTCFLFPTSLLVLGIKNFFYNPYTNSIIYRDTMVSYLWWCVVWQLNSSLLPFSNSLDSCKNHTWNLTNKLTLKKFVPITYYFKRYFSGSFPKIEVWKPFLYSSRLNIAVLFGMRILINNFLLIFG